MYFVGPNPICLRFIVLCKKNIPQCAGDSGFPSLFRLCPNSYVMSRDILNGCFSLWCMRWVKILFNILLSNAFRCVAYPAETNWSSWWVVYLHIGRRGLVNTEKDMGRFFVMNECCSTNFKIIGSDFSV